MKIILLALVSAVIAAPFPAQETSSDVAADATTLLAAAPLNGRKRGLAYNDAGLVQVLGGQFGFAYNWAQTENSNLGTMFIPQMHKPSDSSVQVWLANVDAAVKKGSSAVMGFNECDDRNQCNLPPQQACQAWMQYMNPVKAKYPHVTIIGPSITNAGGPSASTPNMGLDWLSKFHAACPDAAVDETNIHYYDIYQEKTSSSSSTIERLQAQVEAAAKRFGKKVWLTEYGLNPGSASEAQAVTFMRGSLQYLDNAPQVQGYSYFMLGTDQSHYELIQGDGPSAVGKVYNA